jgi:methionine-S-sulfoxide reductase
MRHNLRASLLLSLLSVLVAGCGTSGCGASTAPRAAHSQASPAAPAAPAAVDLRGGTVEAAEPPAGLAVATFAGGCFWCMEAAFEHQAGVRDAISGYTGGPELHPGYEQVSNHGTGHAEAIRVLFDPSAVTYEQLLDLYWRRVDPVHEDQAFVDRGHQYRSVIYAHTPAQRAAAERSLQAIAASGRFHERIVTTVEDATVFWVAEDFHQDFWRTSPDRYEGYHEHSGRREFLRAHWGPDAPY